jgi:hypothetical protein
MFDSTVLEVAVGLTFCFCSVSLIVSSVSEGISSFLKLRGRYLLGGLKILLNDPAGSGLVLDLYNHARLNPGGSGRAPALEQLHGLPSYVEPRQFAVALIEVLQAASATPGAPADLLIAIDRVPEGQLRDVLRNMYRRAGADAQRFETEVASWFDNAMDRLSGDYKRTMQWCALLVGFVLAVLLNIDALHLFKVLWAHPALMQQIDTTQLPDAYGAIGNLTATSLPIGWERAPFTYQAGVLARTYDYSDFAQMAAGWAITASSTLFGAPFWFDLLQKITHLRGTGPKAA